MDNVKITVTIELPGSRLYKDSEVRNQEGTLDLNKVVKKEYLYFNPKTRNREKVSYFLNKCVPARMNINMTYDAYVGFTGENPPSSFKGHWKNLTKTAKVRAHLEEIAEEYKGKLIDSFIFED